MSHLCVEPPKDPPRAGPIANAERVVPVPATPAVAANADDVGALGGGSPSRGGAIDQSQSSSLMRIEDSAQGLTSHQGKSSTAQALDPTSSQRVDLGAPAGVHEVCLVAGPVAEPESLSELTVASPAPMDTSLSGSEYTFTSPDSQTPPQFESRAAERAAQVPPPHEDAGSALEQKIAEALARVDHAISSLSIQDGVKVLRIALEKQEAISKREDVVADGPPGTAAVAEGKGPAAPEETSGAPVTPEVTTRLAARDADTTDESPDSDAGDSDSSDNSSRSSRWEGDLTPSVQRRLEGELQEDPARPEHPQHDSTPGDASTVGGAIGPDVPSRPGGSRDPGDEKPPAGRPGSDPKGKEEDDIPAVLTSVGSCSPPPPPGGPPGGPPDGPLGGPSGNPPGGPPGGPSDGPPGPPDGGPPNTPSGDGASDGTLRPAAQRSMRGFYPYVPGLRTFRIHDLQRWLMDHNLFVQLVVLRDKGARRPDYHAIIRYLAGMDPVAAGPTLPQEEIERIAEMSGPLANVDEEMLRNLEN